MTAESARESERRTIVLRMWRELLLLRSQPHTLEDLARKLSVSARTIRRDLKALQAIPLPIQTRFPEEGHRRHVRAVEPQLWYLGEIAEWPRREVVPVADLGAPTLPPFPQGPLLPPGARL